MKATIYSCHGEIVASFEDSAIAILALPAIVRAARKPLYLKEYSDGNSCFLPGSKAVVLPRGCYWSGNALYCRP